MPAAAGLVLLGALTAAAVISGCARRPPAASDWLIISAGDTISVHEAGIAWTSLSPDERRELLSGRNPVGDFVLAIGRNRLVTAECERLGITVSPAVLARAAARNRALRAQVCLDLMEAAISGEFSPADLDAFRSVSNSFVIWAHSPGETGSRVVDAAIIEAEDLRAILEPGADSTMMTPAGMLLLDSLVPRYHRDAMHIEDSLPERAVRQQMASRRLEALLASELRLAGIDSLVRDARPALHALLSEEAGNADILVSSDALGTLRVLDLRVEHGMQAAMEELRHTGSTDRLEELLRRALLDSYLSICLARDYPAASDSLDSLLADASVMLIAADSLYALCVSGSISITEADILRYFETMPEPIVIPETRVFMLAHLPDSAALADYRVAMAAGHGDEYLSAAGGPASTYPMVPGTGMTLPLLRQQLPYACSAILFSLGPSDTSAWHGPYELVSPPGHLMARLVEIRPAHEASLEEARRQVELGVRTTREAERFTRWMVELEQRHGLQVNDSVLNGLPADPSAWVSIP
ncbi:peptidyl-prolyl cis-trans isomerase [Candidatus Fermentibacterales bacterium]|nr:peptidyl-prolyl cis-trans isomerase [Candidatus Fermentibacterales bacterium]